MRTNIYLSYDCLGPLSYNLCQFLLDNMDRRLFLFTQQSAIPWDWNDLHTSHGARAVHNLSLSTSPLVPHLHTSRGPRAFHDLGLTTPPPAATLHTSHGARALNDLSLSTPSSVDNNPPTTSPCLPPWPLWLLFSGNWRPMHAVRTICDARELPGSLKMFLRLLRSQ